MVYNDWLLGLIFLKMSTGAFFKSVLTSAAFVTMWFMFFNLCIRVLRSRKKGSVCLVAFHCFFHAEILITEVSWADLAFIRGQEHKMFGDQHSVRPSPQCLLSVNSKLWRAQTHLVFIIQSELSLALVIRREGKLEPARLKSAPQVLLDCLAVTMVLLPQSGLLSRVADCLVAMSPSCHWAEQVTGLYPTAWGIPVPDSHAAAGDSGAAGSDCAAMPALAHHVPQAVAGCWGKGKGDGLLGVHSVKWGTRLCREA